MRRLAVVGMLGFFGALGLALGVSADTPQEPTAAPESVQLVQLGVVVLPARSPEVLSSRHQLIRSGWSASGAAGTMFA